MSQYSATVLCACGCGLPAPLSEKNEHARGYVKGEPRPFRVGHNHRPQRTDGGYSLKYRPDHPRSKHGCVAEHVLIAEAALGHYLPAGAEVHHVDGGRQNNTPSNLVICQDKAYHKLLHVRMKVVKAGGDPNTEKFCADCGRCRPFADFNKSSAHKSMGRQGVCRECQKIRFRKWSTAA